MEIVIEDQVCFGTPVTQIWIEGSKLLEGLIALTVEKRAGAVASANACIRAAPAIAFCRLRTAKSSLTQACVRASEWQIATSVGMGRTAMNEYLRRATVIGIT